MKTLTQTFAKRALSILLVTIMVFSLGITGIVSTSATELELAETGGYINLTDYSKVIYDNTVTNWNCTYIYFVVGNGWNYQVHRLGNITNTNLYRNESITNYSNATYCCIIGSNNVVYSGDGSYDTVKGKASYYTNSYGYDFNINADHPTLITPDSTATHPNISLAYQSSDYAGLVFSQQAYAYKSTSTGNSADTSSTYGTVTLKAHYFNNDYSGVISSVIENQYHCNYDGAVRGTEVTLTANPKDGYAFAGWFSDEACTNKVSSLNPYKYDVQTPGTHYALFERAATISIDSLSYSNETPTVGEEVTITANTSVTNGYTASYSWTVEDGSSNTVDDTDSTGNTFTFVPTVSGAYSVSVTASAVGVSGVTDTETETLNVAEFVHTVNATLSSDTVMVGQPLVITPSSNSDYDVVYTLTDGSDTVYEMQYGQFTYTPTDADLNGAESVTKTFTLSAITTIGSTVYNATKEITVTITPFKLVAKLEAESDEVEIGMTAVLKASAYSPSTVTYTFYNADTLAVITNNTTGIYSFDALGSDMNTTKNFYVVASTIINGVPYTSEKAFVSVNIIDVKNAFNFTVYFKSTDTFGYRPKLTTNGAVVDLDKVYMEKDTNIAITDTNVTQTAKYFWYKAVARVSQAKPNVTVSVLCDRYDMEAAITLNVTEDGQVFYLGVDNLNDGNVMVNMTSWNETMRNWTQSAVHMIYDENNVNDAAIDLASVAANYKLVSMGDANGDGKVNVRDATLIQKSLASMVTLDETGTTVSDVTDDGKVTIKDATAIQKQIAGL